MSTPISPFASSAGPGSGSGPQSPSAAPSQPPVDQNPATAELRNFLANAPRLWTSPNDPPVRKFKMQNGEEIGCVYWKGRFFVTGTDVVKILIFRFQQLGRGILNPKKFEEGVFSDLRNLKPGTEAVLEEPRSEFLEFLHKHGCIRTQKKQKVFFWNKVPHDDLFREALERNLKRVTNVFNWTQMMNSPDMVKQYMMLQAAAANGQMVMPGAAGPCVMMPTQYMSYHPQMAMHQGMPGGSPLSMGGHPHYEMRVPPQRTTPMSGMEYVQQMPMMHGGIAHEMAHPAATAATTTTTIAPSSALSSPMFTPGAEINENYFDVPLAGQIDYGHGESHESLPETIAPSVLLGDDPSSPALCRYKVDSVMMSELGALSSAPAPAPAAAPNQRRGDPMMDAGLAPDLTGSDLLHDLWPGEKSAASMNSPLWDDLSMLMPNIAPNLRDFE